MTLFIIEVIVDILLNFRVINNEKEDAKEKIECKTLI
ncbi:hypothetical protein LCGC14_0123430 [marine sediment metagenome]|uniref:Uncharacterized protein n=1 Tax=marine sediment metagenome TaxID=412755 RepID=A0A0F9VAA2_9ZZZZ|tara:strand:- start:4313 stop:4423 length:111 start_codon:yes stop_codon:yes gene_type:complete